MAASPAASSRRSPASSSASLRHSDQAGPAAVPVDKLVNHLLAAKRSLSSMNLVLRANEIANAAQHAHEDTAVMAAQAGFLRGSILDEVALLVRVRRGLQATYDWGKRDFKKLIRAMDEVDGELAATMDMLRSTEVNILQERKNLLDFVDEASVHGMRDAMKQSIEQLQSIQQSFDGDLLRFDTDIRSLKRTLVEPLPRYDIPTSDLLLSLVDHSSNMAHLLASLTKHFDMCVTAIRTTEGAVDLARRKAAEVTQSQSQTGSGSGSGGGVDGVSISGVIAEQESNISDLEPKTAEDRDEMLRVVVQDADEVDDVVQEIQERLAAMEQEHAVLEERTEQTRRAFSGVMDAYAALGEIGARLADYVAAEEDFRARWDLEKDGVLGRLQEMKDMRDFYEGYASAYGSLVLEVERRRAVDERVRAVWTKAQESADRLHEQDRAAREAFRQDVGEFLPTDLWAGMQGPARRWEVVPVDEELDVAPGRQRSASGASKRTLT